MSALSPLLTQATPLHAVRGEGMWLFDADGRRYLDFTAGIGVTSTGHCHPAVVAAIAEQAATPHPRPVHDGAPSRPRRRGRRPRRHAPRARLRGLHQRGQRGGRGGHQARPSGHRATQPHRLPGRVPRPHHGGGVADHLEARRPSRHRTPHGRGGHRAVPRRLPPGLERGRGGGLLPPGARPPPRHHHRRQRDRGHVHRAGARRGRLRAHPRRPSSRGCASAATRHGMLLVADEVQTGVGRTGRFWGMEHSGVRPDIVVTAKGLASGMPLSAIAAAPELMEGVSPAPRAGPTAATRSPVRPPSPPSRSSRRRAWWPTRRPMGERLLDRCR